MHSSINYSDVHLCPFYKTKPIQLTGVQLSELEKLQSMMGAEGSGARHGWP
jgi:hypothetical protein